MGKWSYHEGGAFAVMMEPWTEIGVRLCSEFFPAMVAVGVRVVESLR
jgi:hypothetical protein